MYDNELPALSGPDFLDQVADAEGSNGNEINAAEYRKRAKQWREDLAALQDATAALADVRRRRVDPPAPRAAYAVTPSDRV